MKQFMDVEDIKEALGVSASMAYQMIRELNAELKKKGFLTVRGKISRKYFEEKVYGYQTDGNEGKAV